VRSVVRAVSLAALALTLSGVAAGEPKDQADVVRCLPASGAGVIVGAITNVLHSKVYVGSKYVGTTPFYIASGRYVCTDDTGEALFDLTRSQKSVACIALHSTVVQVTPTADRTMSFQKGATWCSIRPNDGQFASPTGGLGLKAKEPSLVGIIVTKSIAFTKSTAVIKVVEGTISLSTRVKPAVTVRSPAQRRVSSSGIITKERFALSGDEQVAIAQLRLARPTAR
jgi:hypothetical protein